MSTMTTFEKATVHFLADADIARQETVKKMTTLVEGTLRQFGTRQIAEEFVKIYEHHRELASHATENQFEDWWSHEQLMKFLKDGEF